MRRCTQCHLNSRSLDDDGMPMLPIMNELSRPWPHWNAEPDFPSDMSGYHNWTELVDEIKQAEQDHPEIVHGAVSATVALPPTLTRGFGVVGEAEPPCEHMTVAPCSTR